MATEVKEPLKVDPKAGAEGSAPEAKAPTPPPSAPTSVSKVAQTAEVTPAEDFKCKYGGKWYHFLKGKKQSVPRSMYEESLKGSGKLQMTV